MNQDIINLRAIVIGSTILYYNKVWRKIIQTWHINAHSPTYFKTYKINEFYSTSFNLKEKKIPIYIPLLLSTLFVIEYTHYCNNFNEENIF